MAENNEYKKNMVLEARKAEGHSRSKMARKCDISEQTFKRVEEGEKSAPQTRWKILNGFNSLEGKKREYTEEYLFPTDGQSSE